MDRNSSPTTSRRRFLYMFGIGAGAVIAADTLFAKQFAGEAAAITLPHMVYDSNLQMMVDPDTGEPLYTRAEMMDPQDTKGDKTEGKKKSKKTHRKTAKNAAMQDNSKPLPTVTAGCSNCPKCDDHCG